MEQQIITNIAAERGIDKLPVLREYYEFLVLREVFNSQAGDKLVFKGGTALRIFYGLPRYSDDLDFSLSGSLTFRSFTGAMKVIEKKYPVMEISDIWNKRNTYICEFKIKEGWQKEAFSLKLEVSKRKKVKKSEYELKMAESPDFGIQLLAMVCTAEAIFKDKVRAIKERDEPKDYFDLWFLSQLLKREFNPREKPDSKRYKQVLGKYLPAKYKKILGEIL